MKRNDDLKDIAEAVRSIKDQQSVMNKKLDNVIEDLGNVEGQLNHPKTGLKRINEKLDALWDQTVKLTTGEENTKEVLKSQAESLERTNSNSKRVEKRLRNVENHSGIVPAPELTLFE